MNEQRPTQPYKNLGEHLKVLRQKMQESVAEVSGAVEIDEAMLKRIEQGQERPTEDILLLLISHFDMPENDAAGLWRLAGYEQPRAHSHEHDDETPSGRATVLVMAVDPRVVYSDGVQVIANPNGVILNFAQAAGSPSALVTARVGMSRQQAYKVVETLQAMIYKSEPRQLPAPTAQKKSDAPASNKPQKSDT